VSKFVNVRVKKAGGGFRTQRAMVLASGRYRFVKNSGRKASRKRKGHKTMAKRRHRRTRAIVRRSRSYHPHRRHHRRRRRHGGGGGGIRPLPFALAAAGIAYLTSNNGPKTVKDMVAKIPGNKTFGAPAMLGIGCLAVDKFVKRNKWLRLAGYAGIAAAAMKIGEQGSAFKWVGDDSTGDIDLSGDYDMGDVDDVEDVEDVDDVDDVGDED
jgi:hypothetical protein